MVSVAAYVHSLASFDGLPENRGPNRFGMSYPTSYFSPAVSHSRMIQAMQTLTGKNLFSCC